MVFSSPIFLFLFLPLVLGGYFLCGRSVRNGFLFGASLFFYAWGEQLYIAALLGSLAVNYRLASGIERRTDNRGRKRLLILSLCFNLGLLIAFKYAHFFGGMADYFLRRLGLSTLQMHLQPLHLPIGVSFFTFQAMSYVIDVYRREVPAERSFSRFGLYVFLFPHLIAGPIVRYRDIADQLVERPIPGALFASGIRRFIVGLAKKMLLANTLAATADRIFELPAAELSTAAAWLGIGCYTLQIYFDFSGYSDMAIGLGRMFGFHFLENFNFPYTAKSITDFWRRWHISLSSWFRDYLYIPLGGNRLGPARTYANLLIVFALCGLWHGANWTFLIWGIFHGIFLIVERLGFGRVLEKFPVPFRHGYVLFAVMIGWVFFRASGTTQAWQYLNTLFGGGSARYEFGDFWDLEIALAVVFGLFCSLPLLPWLKSQFNPETAPTWRRGTVAVCEMAVLYAIFFFAVVRMAAETYQPFIYFRF